MRTASGLSANVFCKPVRVSNKINYTCRITVVSLQSLLQSSLHIHVTFTLFTQSAVRTNEVAWKNPFVHYVPASTACHYLHCRTFGVYK